MKKYILSFAVLLIAFACESDDKVTIQQYNRSLDSLKVFYQDYAATKQQVYELEKEVRTIEYYHQQDFTLLAQKMDSISKLPPSQTQSGKGWRILGAVLGEIGKRTIPGL